MFQDALAWLGTLLSDSMDTVVWQLYVRSGNGSTWLDLFLICGLLSGLLG